jgi:hypothetical protein
MAAIFSLNISDALLNSPTPLSLKRFYRNILSAVYATIVQFCCENYNLIRSRKIYKNPLKLNGRSGKNKITPFIKYALADGITQHHGPAVINPTTGEVKEFYPVTSHPRKLFDTIQVLGKKQDSSLVTNLFHERGLISFPSEFSSIVKSIGLHDQTMQRQYYYEAKINNLFNPNKIVMYYQGYDLKQKEILPNELKKYLSEEQIELLKIQESAIKRLSSAESKSISISRDIFLKNLEFRKGFSFESIQYFNDKPLLTGRNNLTDEVKILPCYDIKNSIIKNDLDFKYDLLYNAETVLKNDDHALLALSLNESQ